MTTRLENLYKMRDKYRDQGLDVAADRVEARIREIEPDPHPVCDQCNKSPCQCDAMYDSYQDRIFFPDDND